MAACKVERRSRLAFVSHLDLAELGFDVMPEATGRPHLSVLQRLFIYGYLNRVASSRGPELEAGRNLEVSWLLGRLVPDDNVIADFRKDKPRHQIGLLEVSGVVPPDGTACDGECPIDGSKFKAMNNGDKLT